MGQRIIKFQVSREEILADFRALSKMIDDMKILLSTDWGNVHETLFYNAFLSVGSDDDEAKKMAWATQVRALRNESWCAGKDSERYCENKQGAATKNMLWRRAPAKVAIIQEIHNLLDWLKNNPSLHYARLFE